MAEADLDILIRSIARKNSKTLMDAAKKRRGKYLAMAAKAANKATRDRYRAGGKKHPALRDRRRPQDSDFGR